MIANGGKGGVVPNRGENAFEQLSREIHQIQINGGIHSEWLNHPRGYLRKPDFKRKQQHMGAGGKNLIRGVVGFHLRLPGATYKRRWFVLDGMILRYFKSESDNQEAGMIHLQSVNAVLPSSVRDAPQFALDLVCADRIYTVAADDREDMVRWATVLTQVLRGDYKPKRMHRESTSVARASVVRSGSIVVRQSSQRGILSSKHLEKELPQAFSDIESKNIKDINEKIVTVTFDEEGPLNLVLQGTIEDEVMVTGFEEPVNGGIGLAESCGAIKLGDILIAVNDHYFTTIDFKEAIDQIKNAKRPLTLRFLRVDSPSENESSVRVAEGWVLAKEPASCRYRVRMLQLCGNALSLYKPALHSGRQESPCFKLSMDDVSDIRIFQDVSADEHKFQSKEWGITIQGFAFLFTFFPNSFEEMQQWLDLLKNNNRSSNTIEHNIPVHPLTIVKSEAFVKEQVLMEGFFWKLGELTQCFEPRHFVLYHGGKILYYMTKNQQKNNVSSTTPLSHRRPLGTIRSDSIVSLSLFETVDRSASSINLAELADDHHCQSHQEQEEEIVNDAFGDDGGAKWQLEVPYMLATICRIMHNIIHHLVKYHFVDTYLPFSFGNGVTIDT